MTGGNEIAFEKRPEKEFFAGGSSWKLRTATRRARSLLWFGENDFRAGPARQRWPAPFI
jgi:hypothetical protein